MSLLEDQITYKIKLIEKENTVKIVKEGKSIEPRLFVFLLLLFLGILYIIIYEIFCAFGNKPGMDNIFLFTLILCVAFSLTIFIWYKIYKFSIKDPKGVREYLLIDKDKLEFKKGILELKLIKKIWIEYTAGLETGNSSYSIKIQAQNTIKSHNKTYHIFTASCKDTALMISSIISKRLPISKSNEEQNITETDKKTEDVVIKNSIFNYIFVFIIIIFGLNVIYNTNNIWERFFTLVIAIIVSLFILI